MQEAKRLCREVVSALRMLKDQRDMSLNEVRLTVAIEDPRARERRLMGMEVRGGAMRANSTSTQPLGLPLHMHLLHLLGRCWVIECKVNHLSELTTALEAALLTYPHSCDDSRPPHHRCTHMHALSQRCL